MSKVKISGTHLPSARTVEGLRAIMDEQMEGLRAIEDEQRKALEAGDWHVRAWRKYGTSTGRKAPTPQLSEFPKPFTVHHEGEPGQYIVSGGPMMDYTEVERHILTDMVTSGRMVDAMSTEELCEFLHAGYGGHPSKCPKPEAVDAADQKSPYRFQVGALWRRSGGQLYVVHQERGHELLLSAVQTHTKVHPLMAQLLETRAELDECYYFVGNTPPPTSNTPEPERLSVQDQYGDEDGV